MVSNFVCVDSVYGWVIQLDEHCHGDVGAAAASIEQVLVELLLRLLVHLIC